MRLLLALLLGGQVAHGQNTFSATRSVSVCKTSEFFNPNSLGCQGCKANSVQDSSKGGLQCSCKAGYRLGATACQVCSGQASTMDRTACISCDIHKNATLDTTTLNCKCPYVNQALYETTQGGVPTSAGCVTCATTHFIDAASGLCTRCPHPSMASTPSTGGVANAQLAPNSGGGPGVGSCACPSATHTQVPQLFAEDTCFFTESDVYKAAATAVTTGASQLTYPAGALSGATDKGAGKLVRTEAAIGPVTSRAFTLLFLPSAAACNSKALADNSATLPAQADATRACQAVGNLCVLNRYQNGGVCDAYKALVQEPLATNSIPGWPAMMPWIYYTQDRGAVFGSLPIGMKVGVKSRRGLEPDAGVVTRLSFVLSSWTMNGTWLGYKNLTGHLTSVCGANRGSSFLYVGYNWVDKCDISLEGLLAYSSPGHAGSVEGGPPVLYDLFLVDENPGGGEGGEASTAEKKSSLLEDGFRKEASSLLGGWSSPDGTLTLIPIPVTVTGPSVAKPAFSTTTTTTTTEDAEPAKSTPPAEQEALKRRFFLVDAFSGRMAEESADGSESSDSPTPADASSSAGSGGIMSVRPSYIRFASDIKLEIKHSFPTMTRLMIPHLTVVYTDVVLPPATAEPGSGAAVADLSKLYVPFRFEATYTTELQPFMVTVDWLFAIVIIACIVWALLKTGWWRSRNFVIVCDSSSASMFLWHAFAYVGTGLYVLSLGLSLYYLFIYKTQTNIYLMVPDSSDLSPLTTAISLAAAFKIIHVSVAVVRQCRQDVFFLDWEASHGMLKVASSGADKDSADKSAPIDKNAPVSAWRSIFCCNEYNELQTHRVTSTELTLFTLLLLLRGLGLEYLALPIPDATQLQPGTTNPLLRFAVTAGLFTALFYTQFLFKTKVWHKLFEQCKEGAFLDFISVANVSMFIIPEDYCGYYLHGKSVFPHADVSLDRIIVDLRDEELGRVAERGLLKEDYKESQSFEIFFQKRQGDGGMGGGGGRGGGMGGGGGLPDDSPLSQYRNVIEHFKSDTRDNVSAQEENVTSGRSISDRREPGQRDQNASHVGRNHHSGAAMQVPSEGVAENYRGLNNIFKEFVECFQDGNFTPPVMDKGRFHESFGYPPLERLPSEATGVQGGENDYKPLMFFDPNLEFTSTMLMGLEEDIFVAQVLLWSTCDFTFGNSFLSALVVFVADKLLVSVRDSLGQANLAAKSMVDQRFLL